MCPFLLQVGLRALPFPICAPPALSSLLPTEKISPLHHKLASLRLNTFSLASHHVLEEMLPFQTKAHSCPSLQPAFPLHSSYLALPPCIPQFWWISGFPKPVAIPSRPHRLLGCSRSPTPPLTPGDWQQPWTCTHPMWPWNFLGSTSGSQVPILLSRSEQCLEHSGR